MASSATVCSVPLDDIDTDYGSDFSPEEEVIIQQLLSRDTASSITPEDESPIVNDIQYHNAWHALHLPRTLSGEEKSLLFQAARAAEQITKEITQSIRGENYSDLSSEFRRPQNAEPDVISEEVISNVSAPDTRSPIVRFRTRPQKALSVTDLISPAWCELQYWYTLTKHGRKRQTPAMKQGIAVHQKLEDQVHTTVKVDIQTKEDAWGLRIWNVIQGLRTLRYTGLTRELEIWGVVDGLCVNGIIDELSYTCPDTELETSLEGFANTDGPAPDQPTISEFFKAHGGATIAEATRNKRRSQSKKVYLCDVKTRGVKRLPTHAAFRPTKIQLMLYHRLLAELATNMVDFSVLTARYDLDSTKIFSDSFLAQVSSLNDDLFHNVAGSHNSQDSDLVWSQDSMSTLLTHNTLSALWSLMITEFQLTLPNGVGSLGRVLKAEYRSRDTGEILGSKEFAMDHEDLGLYLRHEMKWWKGEREAEGVTVEEAFKCRSCDFADECEWRLKKAEEAKEKGRGVVRQRRAAVQ